MQGPYLRLCVSVHIYIELHEGRVEAHPAPQNYYFTNPTSPIISSPTTESDLSPGTKNAPPSYADMCDYSCSRPKRSFDVGAAALLQTPRSGGVHINEHRMAYHLGSNNNIRITTYLLSDMTLCTQRSVRPIPSPNRTSGRARSPAE